MKYLNKHLWKCSFRFRGCVYMYSYDVWKRMNPWNASYTFDRCMVSLKRGFADVSSVGMTDWIPCHTHHNSMASLLCGSASDVMTYWNPFHTDPRSRAFLQCGCAHVRSNYMSEALVTLITEVGFLSSVNTLMTLQIWWLTKALVTLIAGVEIN